MATAIPLWRGVVLAASVVASVSAFAGQASGAAGPTGKSIFKYKDLCANTIRRIEAQGRFPTGLMQAIALVESGRSDATTGAKFAWPWTVHAEGRGRYFASKAAAVSAVRKLQAKGVSNIDVGCMQVNLYYHGDQFDSIEAALDPVRNAVYAARFLKRLYDAKGSWNKAVALYHSSTPKLNRPYRAKVYRAWREHTGDQQVAHATDRPAPTSPRQFLHKSPRPNRHLLPRSRRLQAAQRSAGPTLARARGAADLTSSDARTQPRKNLLRRLRPASGPRFRRTAKTQGLARGQTNPMRLNRPKTLRLYRQLGAAPKTYRHQLTAARDGLR